MELKDITAIGPVDGRYRSAAVPLDEYFSEFALIRYRVRVEIEYLIALADLPLPQLDGMDEGVKESLRDIYRYFTTDDAMAVKQTEKTTNHDVKAVEYFIKDKLEGLGLEKYKEFVHFGLTSQDVNNTATPLSIKEALRDVYAPVYKELTETLSSLVQEWGDIPMLARTHGQPASPTNLGKELKVFIARLEKQYTQLTDITPPAKFGGATGNFNAHYVAYPGVDWNGFAMDFVNGILGLDRSYPTTQIEHYDNLAAIFDAMARINTILLDLCRDIWTYVSMEYFKQKIKEGEVGSSAMPHKVNPIDFENAEGNLGIANALLGHLSAKLPVSRLQRDLTDSTVLRNVGVPFAHSIIAFKSVLKGLNKLIVNRDAISADLEDNWAVVAEGIQTVLRREGYPRPYEALKALTRTNSRIDARSISEFIDTLDVSPEIKEELKKITPHNYTGII